MRPASKHLCGLAAALAAGTLLLGATEAAAGTVYANAASGDAFTNAGGSNQGQAIGASGWYYNNVRGNGGVGITADEPRGGNGSVAFASPSGTAKADIEYLAGGVSIGGNYVATASLGAFVNFVSMTYEWYRDSGSTVSATQWPSLRILLDADGDLSTTGDRGGLVFETVYNTNFIPTDSWVTETVGATTNLWNFGLGMPTGSNINATPYAYDATLAEWQAYLPNAAILGFSSGIGSGWSGTFAGAVDNIGWQIGNATTMTNFELAATEVPEPASLGLFGLGLAGMIAMRRRSRRR